MPLHMNVTELCSEIKEVKTQRCVFLSCVHGLGNPVLKYCGLPGLLGSLWHVHTVLWSHIRVREQTILCEKKPPKVYMRRKERQQ